jgi:uncharacterized protein YjiS (DUF1127 family)
MLKKSDKTQVFYAESRAYDSIGVQRLMAEAVHLRSKTLSELFGRAVRWAGGIVKAMATSVSEGIRLRNTYRELMALDDHMLADIGISRAEIPQVVARSAVRGRVPADVHILKAAQGRTPDDSTDETERPLAA